MGDAIDFRYSGSELQLFAQAKHWKRYWCTFVAPYLRGDVLEVGAGVGSNTRYLRDHHQNRWVCLEPDRALLAQLEQNAPTLPCEMRPGTLADVPASEQFEVILYLDVLEHIEDDKTELKLAANHLKVGGRLIVLAPAHPQLFSPFDTAIGHHRRYNKPILLAAAPPELRSERMLYLDSCGCSLSLCNRLMLRKRMPTPEQIRFWDCIMVPLSRVVDQLLGYSIGKSILAVWTKTSTAAVHVP